MSKNTRNRILLTAVAALLLVAVTVGGTLAWLQDNTEAVINEFTPTTISVDLTEEEDQDTNTANHQFKMIPGAEIDKDPKVTVTSVDVDAWLFVEINESDNLDYFISYAKAEGWEFVDGFTATSNPTVIYREITKSPTAQEFSVLAGDKVTVNDEVTTARMDDLIDGTETQPTLTFKAYVVQKEAATTAAAAWTLAKQSPHKKQ